MPPDFGQLLGQPAFEQARGAIMYLCACDAEEARGRMIEIVGLTSGSPEGLIGGLLTLAGRAELRPLLQPYANWPDSR